ncbi:hypothetical protein LCGC14_0804560 [marine sediment metagenome]|uniref:ParB/Sulfiredoxin domain-containing protein n=1 Tax=marine sediment metagenome TaxID=412755 RepID=A0A0F9S8Q5_9ZZZZ
MVEYYFANVIIKDVKLSEIKVDPQVRIRKYDATHKNWIKHEALKNSMNKFGQLHSITLLKNYKLKAGFDRYSVAIELGWETIRCRIFLEELTKLDELLLEITENYARKDFTSIELFSGFAMIKREYEGVHPEVMHGKAIREQCSPLRDHEKNEGNKVASDATLKNDHKNKVLSFVKYYHKFFGIAERTLYNYTRIGEAYLDNKFNEETITLFEKGKLTQTQLLETLRKFDNKRIIQSKLKTNRNDNIKSKNDLLAIKTIIKIENKNNKPKSAHKVKERTPEEIEDFVISYRKSIVENFISSGKKLISSPSFICDSSIENPEKSPNKTSKEDKTLSHKEANSPVPANQIPKKDTCLTCEKASVFAFKCKSCGSIGRQVLCDIDFIEARRKIRDPDLPRCESSNISP